MIREGMMPVGIGIVLGLAAAAIASRWLGSVLVGVSGTDAPTFAAVSIVLMIVALVACSIPARRALRVDPINVLRLN